MLPEVGIGVTWHHLAISTHLPVLGAAGEQLPPHLDVMGLGIMAVLQGAANV